jgi:acetyl esterase/lipase
MRIGRNSVTAAVLVFVITLSASAADRRTDTNIVFGTYAGLALLMDVHRPATPNGYGIIVINGSGWHRDPDYDEAMLKDSQGLGAGIDKLVGAGYTAFVINHRAAPGFHIRDAINDAQRAVRFVRANAARYGILPDRIGAFGGSSGGHLVSMLGTLDGRGNGAASDAVERESAKVQCVVALFPAIDLAKIDTATGAVAVGAIMGTTPPRPDHPSPAQVTLYHDASPINYVTADDAPFLLVHGDRDQTVPYQQSEIMEAALKNVNVPVRLVRVPGGGHGARGAEWKTVDWAGMTLDWFESHLRQGGNAAASIR